MRYFGFNSTPTRSTSTPGHIFFNCTREQLPTPIDLDELCETSEISYKMSENFIPTKSNQSADYRIDKLVYYKAFEEESMSLIMIAEGFLPFIMGNIQ